MKPFALKHTAVLPESRRSAVPAWIDATRLRESLSMLEAIDALDDALQTKSMEAASPRLWFEAGEAQLAFMQAVGPDGGIVKLVSVQESNVDRDLPIIQGIYVVFEPETYTPVALIGGAELTSLRTPAVSGLATRYMAREDSRKLVVFGSGVQARGHVEAMRAVRPIEEVVVVSKTKANAQKFVDDLEKDGVDARVGDASDVATADIICTCTTSSEPLFDGSLLPKGVHINAIGSYKPDVRELDSTAMLHARVVVEDRSVSVKDAGDIALPIDEGLFTESHVLSDLMGIVGGFDIRVDDDSRTVFKSIGMAFEDSIISAAVVRSLG